MELRHLRYFVAVAEELNFRRAAERLCMAQPPLSQQILQLEREVGADLFVRTKRRVELSAAGQAFLDDARAILSRSEEAAETARKISRGEKGWLNVAFVGSATYRTLPPILRRFRERHPEVELLLYEMNDSEQVQAFAEKRIHVSLARPPLEGPDLEVELLETDGLVVALPAGHPLAEQTAVSLQALDGEAYIDFPGPGYLVQACLSCPGLTVEPRVVQVAREMHTVICLVAAGLGMSLVPAATQCLAIEGVVYRPVAESSVCTALSIVYRRDDPSPIIPAFVAVAREVTAGNRR